MSDVTTLASATLASATQASSGPASSDPAARRPFIRAEIPPLTSIRGFAAWWVVFYHFRDIVAAPNSVAFAVMAHGYLAVDLFFQLSGLVIALNYAGGFERIDLRAWRRFLALRFARVYPLHAVILVAYVSVPLSMLLLTRAGTVGNGFSPAYWVCSALLVQNWGMFGELQWNGPAWSISSEAAAYLVFPLLAWAGVRLARRPLGGVAWVLVLLLGLGGLAAATGVGLADRITTLGTVRCILEFSLGLGLWHLLHHLTPLRLAWGNVATLLAAAVIGAGLAAGLMDAWVFPLGFLLLLAGLCDSRSVLARALTGRFALWLGRISYATYLVHYLLKVWIKFLLVRDGIPPALTTAVYVAAVLGASVLLHQFVETRCRVMLRRRIDASALFGRANPAKAYL